MKLEIERDLHIDADCVASESNEYVAKVSEVLQTNLPSRSVGTFKCCVLSVGI